MTVALALDFGSSRFKAGAVREDGSLANVQTRPAPPLRGQGLIREGDPTAHLERAAELLGAALSGLPRTLPTALASQRSTFLVWDRKTGAPATPVISWEDRRAEAWCAKRHNRNLSLIERTGLLLSPHYAGPKLACLLEADTTLRRAADRGSLAFGTLETWLLWHWTGGAVHETDLSMAARTLLADPEAGAWSGELLDLFGVPSVLLPSLVPTWGRAIPLDAGGVVTATVSDQAAGLLAVMQGSRDLLLVNLGTGGFVTRPSSGEMRRIPHYLSGPLFLGPNRERSFAVEGTINGIGHALADLEHIKVVVSERDPLPGRFCLPDTSGLGSPFWRADLPSFFSIPESELGPADKKRLILEGVLFRAAQIAEDLCGPDVPEEIYLSGGLLSLEFIRLGLPAVLEQPVQILEQTETTLEGAGRLALGLPGRGAPAVRGALAPGAKGAYLAEKFGRWKEWAREEVRRLQA